MTAEQNGSVAVGALLVLAAFFYTGSYKGAFVYGRRKPDYPPNFLMRVIFLLGGLLIIWAAVTDRLR